MENASTTSILQQKMSFIVAILTATITDCRLCMNIAVRILRKRSDFMKWNKISDGLPPIGYPLIVTIFD